jgi:peptidoglycan/xylan/chitin deacetylase (PgdA/CDA1 family)
VTNRALVRFTKAEGLMTLFVPRTVARSQLRVSLWPLALLHLALALLALPRPALADAPGLFEPPADAIEQGGPIRCPILYYHDIPTQAGLAAQVAAFLQAGYRPVTMGRLVSALSGQAEPPPNCLVLTFDDGLASQITNGFPVLLRFAVPATFFVMSGDFQDGVHHYMNSDDFRTLRDAGFELGSHTLNHANLPNLLKLNLGAFRAEVVDSKTMLEQELDLPVGLIAYPNGAFDAPTVQEVLKAGYFAAASTRPGAWQRSEELYMLHRIGANPWERPATVLQRLGQ